MKLTSQSLAPYDIIMRPLPTLPSYEDKIYGPDCSEEERKLIKAQTFVYDSETIICRPVKQTSAFTVDLTFETVRELAANLGSFDLIMDLREADRPSAVLRDQIRQRIVSVEKIRRVTAVTGANWIANVAAQFVFNVNGMPSLTVYKTFELAFEELRRAKQR